MTHLTTINCWEPHGSQYAMVSEKNKIILYDTKTSEQSQTLSTTFHINTTFSSIYWTRPIQDSKQNDSKKRKLGTSYLVTGTDSGRAFLWNPDKGELVAEITLSTSKQPVMGIDVDSDKNEIRALLQSGQLARRSLLDGKVQLVSLKCGQATGFSTGGVKYYAVGTVGNTHLFDTSTDKRISQLQGHSLSGASILLIHQDKYLTTATKQDRYINIFNIAASSKSAVVTPKYILSVDSNVSTVDLHIDDDHMIVAVVTENGSLHLFRLDESKMNSKKSVTINEPHALITSEPQLKQGLGTIASCKMDDKDVIIASGNQFNPVFSKTTHASLTGTIRISKAVQLDSTPANNKTLGKALFKRKNEVIADQNEFPANQKGVTVLSMSNMEQPGARYRSLLTDIDPDAIPIDTIMAPPTLIQDSNVPTIKITSTIQHSLRISDNVTLYKCLDQTDKNLIQSTVRDLSPPMAVQLLSAIIQRLQSASNTAESTSQSVTWIRVLLLIHTPSIVANKNVINQLTPLHASISHRMSHLPQLMELSGRLDLMLSLAGYSAVGGSSAGDDLQDDLSAIRSSNANYEIRAESDDEDEEETQVQHVTSTAENEKYQVFDDQDGELEQDERTDKMQGWFINDDDQVSSDEELELLKKLDEEEERLDDDESDSSDEGNHDDGDDDSEQDDSDEEMDE